MTLVERKQRQEGARAPLEMPPRGLVSPPRLDRRLSAWAQYPVRGPGRSDGLESGWWLLGVHGGAGVTSLLRAGAGAGDAGRRWPTCGPVVIVARRTAYGLEWARDAARQYASGEAPNGVLLAGLVVVADAPGRTPPRVAQFLDLLTGAYPRVWEVPWVEEWRLAGYSEPLPSPPTVRHLNEDMRALVAARAHQREE